MARWGRETRCTIVDVPSAGTASPKPEGTSTEQPPRCTLATAIASRDGGPADSPGAIAIRRKSHTLDPPLDRPGSEISRANADQTRIVLANWHAPSSLAVGSRFVVTPRGRSLWGLCGQNPVESGTS